MDPTVLQITQLLSASRLYSAEMAQGLSDRWQASAGDRANRSDLFLQWLVHNGHVTDYQATMLRRGHAEGYFLREYKILERVGRGKMAGVYKAIHSLGQVVAIKVLPPSRAKDAAILGRFQREAQLALRLQHPNTVRTFQTGEADGLHFLIMEYLEGETLEEVLLRRKSFPAIEALRLTIQVLQGLQHIHEQGLVHRDLKPANLMVVPAYVRGQPDTTINGVIKIFDIGLGRTTEQDQDENLDGFTNTGVVLGTPDYMAPEQARDAKTADVRADIYSVGCILYHLLTGQQPFPDPNLINQMVRHATEQARPLAEFGITGPGGLQRVVDSLMAKKPEDRYSTPSQAVQAIQSLLEGTKEENRRPPIPPHVDAYLRWLETDTAVPTIPMPAVPDSGPSTTQLTIAVQQENKPVAPKHTSDGSRKSQTEKAPQKPKANKEPHRNKNLIRPQSKQTPKLPETVDVELVPEPEGPVVSTSAPFQLTRRDLIMMGIGAGGALLAVLGGIGLSALLRMTPPEDPGSPPGSDTKPGVPDE